MHGSPGLWQGTGLALYPREGRSLPGVRSCDTILKAEMFRSGPVWSFIRKILKMAKCGKSECGKSKTLCKIHLGPGHPR